MHVELSEKIEIRPIFEDKKKQHNKFQRHTSAITQLIKAVLIKPYPTLKARVHETDTSFSEG